MFMVPPVWLSTPVELLAVAVFQRAVVVSVPLAMLKVPVPPVTAPIWLSLGVPLTLVVVNAGALEAVPKLNVPLLTSKAHGTVINADAALSASVQFAAPSFRRRAFVPPGLEALLSRFV